MERDKVLEKLADPSLPFLEKLRFAANLEIDLWVERDPPNLGENEFKRLLGHIRSDVKITFDARESMKGKHGSTGDDDVFKFEFSVQLLGYEVTYFVKGYFFDKGACKGVCIQSFREVNRVKVNKFKLVKR